MGKEKTASEYISLQKKNYNQSFKNLEKLEFINQEEKDKAFQFLKFTFYRRTSVYCNLKWGKVYDGLIKDAFPNIPSFGDTIRHQICQSFNKSYADLIKSLKSPKSSKKRNAIKKELISEPIIEDNILDKKEIHKNELEKFLKNIIIDDNGIKKKINGYKLIATIPVEEEIKFN